MNEYRKPECVVLAVHVEDNTLITGTAEDMIIQKDDWDD